MKILLAVDGSPESEAAIQSVATRPWPPGTTVRVLSVAPYAAGLVTSPASAGGALGNPPPALAAAAEGTAARAAEALAGHDLRLESLSRGGDPRLEIVDEAMEFEADLIMLGAHASSGFRRWIKRNVPDYVVRHAPCSVEVVRRPAPKARPKVAVDVGGAYEMFRPPPAPR